MAVLKYSLVLFLGCLTQVICDASASSSAALKISQPTAKLVKSDGSTSPFSGQYPEKFLDGTLIKTGDSLEVSLSVSKDGEAFQPQQVFLRLSSKTHKAAAFFVGKYKKKVFGASVTLSALEKQLGKVGGDFDAAWIVGDPQVSKGLMYEIGTVEVEQAKEAPKLPLTASTQSHTFLKKEIIHQFRAPEKRAPVGVSMLFTGLALVPLLALLISVSSLRVNFKGFPTGTAGLAAAGFHAGIAGMLGLYLIFWLKLNIVETLPLALLGGLVVSLTGYKALSAVADNRLKKD